MTTLAEHLLVEEENRDKAWDESFFKHLTEGNLKILAEDPQQGPDGWPYFVCETSEQPESKEKKIDSAQKILHWLSTRGIGLIVNPKRLPYPDYVFSYGMIWSFRETGLFIQYNNIGTESEKNFEINPDTEIKTGVPSEKYLPPYVRNILKDFFRDQGVFEPRVLMISVDGKNYDLCFSLESLGAPPESEHEGILEAVSWFLPPHYSVAVVSEKDLPEFKSLN